MSGTVGKDSKKGKASALQECAVLLSLEKKIEKLSFLL